MNLHGKTALVTGSTSGIGLGIAKVLAQAGAQLVLNGFGDSSHARAEVAALGKIPGYHDADLRDVGQIEAMMHYAESTFGGVDIVINNAGIQHVAPVEQFPVDKWNDILAINLSSVFHTTRLALPGMRQRNWGRIINIASVHGLVASKEKSAYVAAKHAVVGLTKTVALETARSGITCNAICPGWVLTPLVQQQIDKRIAEGVDPEQASAQLLAEKTALRGVCHPAAAGRNGAVSVQRCRRPGARRRMEHGWRLGGAVSRWRREDQNIARKRFTVRERSKRRQAMAISVFSGAPLSG
ncbi:D-beta-hydroxybutyrate dehydrogenase [Klebsiella aerogenes]|nr:D-beta-hydroxybutyrate dehydrogenase [Klebsiella aerogenes]